MELRQIPIFDDTQCEQIGAQVHRLRHYWIPRREPPCFFFTLGPASYLDCSGTDGTAYEASAEEQNEVLLNAFSEMYQRVLDRLGCELRAPVVLWKKFAIPGFHIWLTRGICTTPVASIHFDLQYVHLKLNGSDSPRSDQVLSFTLPIKLPRAGGGLNVWDLDYQEYQEARARGFVESINEIKRFKTMSFLRYEVGTLVLHSGHMLHQIAPTSKLEQNDERVTLQGHGLFLEGAWHLYW